MVFSAFWLLVIFAVVYLFWDIFMDRTKEKLTTVEKEKKTLMSDQPPAKSTHHVSIPTKYE